MPNYDTEKTAYQLFDALFTTKASTQVPVNLGNLNAWTTIKHPDVAAIEQEDYPDFGSYWLAYEDAYWSPSELYQLEVELEMLERCINLFSQTIAFTEAELKAYKATSEQTWHDYKVAKHLTEEILIPMLARRGRCQRRQRALLSPRPGGLRRRSIFSLRQRLPWFMGGIRRS